MYEDNQNKTLETKKKEKKAEDVVAFADSGSRGSRGGGGAVQTTTINRRRGMRVPSLRHAVCYSCASIEVHHGNLPYGKLLLLLLSVDTLRPLRLASRSHRCTTG